jgi:hypothetical protein
VSRPRQASWSALRWAGPPLLCGALLGCSLADYEDRMAAAQERIKRFDDENRFLGEPLEIPTYKVVRTEGENPGEEQVPVGRLFLRAPKAVNKVAENKAQAAPNVPVTFLYQTEQKKKNQPPQVMDPATGVPIAPIEEVDLAFRDIKKPEEIEQFANEIADRFTGDKTSGTRTVSPLGRRPMTFKNVEAIEKIKDGPLRRSVFVYYAGGKAVAIVYHSRGPLDSVAAAIEHSLSTMGFGDDQTSQNLAWFKRSAPRGIK